MQNKSAIWTFTILLTLACLFQISYSWVTNKVEKRATKEAEIMLDSIDAAGLTIVPYGQDTFDLSKDEEREDLKRIFEEEYLRSVAHEPAYPILGETYQECKERELSMGLDLMGGMSVALEVSIPDLVYKLSGESNNPTFKQAFDAASQRYKENPADDFITLFEEEYESRKPGTGLASVYSLANKDMFSAKMTNEEVIAQLRVEKDAAMGNVEEIMNNRIDKFGVSNARLQRQAGSGRIMIELPGVKDKVRVRALLQSTANLEFWETFNNMDVISDFEIADKALSRELYPDLLLEDENDSLQPKLDTAGVVDLKIKDSLVANFKIQDSLYRVEKDSAQAQLSDEEKRKRNPIFSLFIPAIEQDEKTGQSQWQQGACVGYCRIKDTARLSSYFNHPVVQEVFSRKGQAGFRILWASKSTERTLENTTEVLVPFFCIKNTPDGVPPLDGSVITNARADYNQTDASQIEVVMQMDDEGSQTWARLTGDNANKGAIAIVMDNYVYSAPWVNGKITGGRSSITGVGSIDEAEDLANVLKSGTLPAKAQIVDEAIVGPSLGKSNISSGFYSFIIALALVFIYMFVYYSRAGLIANVALIANIFFLIGSLASIQASLTLPGIAGIVLTMGMAVDANVLIFERIREEMREGKGVKMAVNDGFKKALSSIIDGNLTTLLTAIVLATFGSGPILGFATTLIIGIFTSLFCSIYVTRLIITEMLERKKNIDFSTKLSDSILKNPSFNWLDKRKTFYIISSVVVLVGVGSLVTRGFDYGVEFTGGRTYQIRFEEAPDTEKLRDALGTVFIEDGIQQKPEVKTIENSYTTKITTKYMFDDKSIEADGLIAAKLDEGLKGFGAYKIEASRKVDAVISSELIYGSIMAVAFSLLIIFLYILLRFRRWQYGLAAVIGLFHNVMIVLGLFSLLYGFMPFSMEIDQAFIAAILTVVGYSINDTVVVFDRIREYLREHKRGDSRAFVNNALNSTLSRTLNTSITTLVTLVAIFLFGGEAIKGFSFALLIGVIVGTYSSLCISSPLVFDFAKQNLNETTPVK
jgi:SecD/SecF fusion protein